MRSPKKRSQQSISVWPGYVDALSSLLMVVIFVVMIFTVVQMILSQVISGQESELSTLHRQISELSQALGIEQANSQELTDQVSQLSQIVDSLQTEKQQLTQRNQALSKQSAQDQKDIERQLLYIASYQEDIAALKKMRDQLEQQVGALASELDDKNTLVGNLRDRSQSLEAKLAEQQESTVLAQREVEDSKIRIQALNALIGQQKEALDSQQELTASARSEIVLLNQRIKRLRSQLEEIELALQTVELENRAKESEIKDLGKRLNIALAREVNKLKRYRSEFFGRLQEVLKDVPAIRVEGDRFVFQAELLFDSGSAVLQEAGRQHLGKLASILQEVASQIPTDLDWILRIDGHTDRRPINNEEFRSNWELSTARALEVVHYLAEQGIPEQRMAATGFSKFHPLDPRDTPEAWQRNRRIEIKLTSR